MEDNSLRICTLNCRSLKSSMQDVNRLCESHDIVCLQEHWLLPSELGLLNNIHSDFYSSGSSAVDITGDILVGRPYGGTAILYRKTLCNLVSIFPTSNLRVTGVKMCTGIGPLLLITVYMPTDYNDDVSLENYVDVCAHMNAI
jgi:exonuclease III